MIGAMQNSTQMQTVVNDVVSEIYGLEWSTNKKERGLRLDEESLEAGQIAGVTREQAHALVDRVYDRPPGEAGKEVGDVIICLAAYANAYELTISDCLGSVLEHLLDNKEKYREKFEAKKKAGLTG